MQNAVGAEPVFLRLHFDVIFPVRSLDPELKSIHLAVDFVWNHFGVQYLDIVVVRKPQIERVAKKPFEKIGIPNKQRLKSDVVRRRVYFCNDAATICLIL